MNITRAGLDLAKNIIQIHAVDQSERVVCQKPVKRDRLLAFFRDLPPCLIGMEACAGAHHWARELMRLGHNVRLMAAKHVKPYLQGQKNDANDAAAICEAVGRKVMRFVQVKSIMQQDLQALHRMRSEQVCHRTAKINQVRGLLAEYGIVLMQGSRQVRAAIPRLLEDAENGLSHHFRALLLGLYEDLVYLDKRIQELDRQLREQNKQNEAIKRLQTIPGVGPITASALVAAAGTALQFKNGRQMSAWLGLTPKQHSSGGQTRLLGMHKCGDSYLRNLFIQGANTVQRHAKQKIDNHSQWLNEISKRRHRNIAVVALANKTARTAWAILTKQTTFQENYVHV